MKNIIIIILFLVSIFIINIIFYYTSPAYKDFLVRVKQEASVEQENKSEDFLWKNNKNYFSWTIEDKIEQKKDDFLKNNSKNDLIENDIKEEIRKEEVKLWKWYQEILDLFSEYDFTKVDVNVNLFDLTNEYPDKYFEFYSKKMTVYFFTSKTYQEVFDIFKVLQSESPFKLNETNTFWEKSFFINFNSDINDSFVRTIIVNKWIVFWLKFEKSEYDNIKEKLQNLRNN